MLRRGKRIKIVVVCLFVYLIIHSADFIIKMIVMMIAICVIYVTLAFSFVPQGVSSSRLHPSQQSVISAKKALNRASTTDNISSFENKPKEYKVHYRDGDDMGGMHLNITRGGIRFIGPTSYSHQVSLSWDGGPRRVLVIVKPDDAIVASVIEAVKKLWDREVEVVVEKDMYDILQADIGDHQKNKLIEFQENTEQGVDVIITFGGDGTLMHCSSMFTEQRIPPIMSFDFGSLGFLSPFQFENFEEDIDQMIREGVTLTLRMRLECHIQRRSGSSGVFETISPTMNVLNEVVVARGPVSFIGVLDIACDNRYMTTLQGDGIIIATPTGSTAYSLAAGGSMVHPQVSAMLLTPVCAHTLSFRPLLVPDSSVLEVMVPEECRGNAWASFDGKFRTELQQGDLLHVKQSLYPMPTVNRANYTIDWFDALRSGFMFNERSRQSSKIPLK